MARLPVAARTEEKLDGRPVLHPGIGIEPHIEVMAGKMPRQEGPAILRLAILRRLATARKIQVPARCHHEGALAIQPAALVGLQPDIQHAEREPAPCGLSRIERTVPASSSK